MVSISTIIGLFAGTLATISFLPQVIKAWKSKQTKDISLPMYILFVIGVSLWLIYGLMINELPVILANAVTLILAGIILTLKLKYK